jgi:hypothetical protein
MISFTGPLSSIRKWLGLVRKLNVTPEDNDTDGLCPKQAAT